MKTVICTECGNEFPEKECYRYQGKWICDKCSDEIMALAEEIGCALSDAKKHRDSELYGSWAESLGNGGTE